MFTVNRKQLADELALLQTVAERKTTMPVLSNVMLDLAGDKLTLYATDLDASIVTEVAAEGEPWTGCLPMTELTKFVRLSESEQVVFQVKETRMLVKAGKAKCLLPMVERSQFPALPTIPAINGLTLSGETLRTLLTRVMPCATNEPSRYNMRGVKFEAKDGTLRLIATDGHRLGVATLAIEGAMDTLVPADGLAPLLKTTAGSITMQADDKQAWFRCNHQLITMRLLDGQFPRWEMIWPKALPYQSDVATEPLAAAFRRVEITRDAARGSAVRMSFQAGSISIDSGETDRGQCDELLDATSNLNGEAVLLGVNPDYVMDFLRHAGERVKCEFKDNSNVVKMSDGSAFEYVVMPMRL